MTVRDEIKAIITYMVLAFPNFHPTLDGTPNSVDVYQDLLGDMNFQLLMLATKTACAERGRKFAPSAGEIRGTAAKIHLDASGTPTSSEAWEAIMESFRVVKSQRPKLLDHPIVAKAIRAMGGLDTIGMSENNMADRAHFLKIYDQLLERGLDNAAMLVDTYTYIASIKKLTGGENPIVYLAEKLRSPLLPRGEE